MSNNNDQMAQIKKDIIEGVNGPSRYPPSNFRVLNYEWQEELLTIPLQCRNCEHRTKVSPNIPHCYHPEFRDGWRDLPRIPFASDCPDYPDWCPLCVKKSPTVTQR